MEKSMKLLGLVGMYVLVAIVFTGCVGGQVPPPTAMVAPTPILGNDGEFMCPYTQDGVLAEWTDNAVNAKMGAAAGQMAGAYAGQQALSAVPFVGSLLGSQAGEYVGRSIALESAGGMDLIRSSSDVSFNSLEDMSVFMYANYSTNEHYQSALDASMEIYPDLQRIYTSALYNAPTR